MQFSSVRKEIKGVDFASLRTDCDNYFEAVVMKEELEKLTSRLDKVFGTPIWPSRNSLSFETQKVIDGFGGIMPGQTLYFWNKGQDTIFAMLWPWKDGERATLKIVQK